MVWVPAAWLVAFVADEHALRDVGPEDECDVGGAVDGEVMEGPVFARPEVDGAIASSSMRWPDPASAHHTGHRPQLDRADPGQKK